MFTRGTSTERFTRTVKSVLTTLIGTGWAQPEETTWGLNPVDPSSPGANIGVVCSADRARGPGSEPGQGGEPARGPGGRPI